MLFYEVKDKKKGTILVANLVDWGTIIWGLPRDKVGNEEDIKHIVSGLKFFSNFCRTEILQLT